MPDMEKVIADIEEQIAWIRDNNFHKFPGWGHAVLAMKDALALLKEQEELLRKLQKDKDTLCLEISKLKHLIHDKVDEKYMGDL